MTPHDAYHRSDEYQQEMRDQGRCLVRITPTRWGPVATDGLPARLVAG